MEGRLRNMTALYLLRGEKILLLYRQGGRVVNEVWTGSVGGHFEEEELNDAEACIKRELQEELGLLPEDTLDSNEGICKWFSMEEMRSLEMPFTAKYVMEHFYTTGRYSKKLYVGIANADTVKFLELSES